MGLLDLFGKKKKTNSFGEPIDKLTPEGELPWGWIAAHKEFTERIQKESKTFLDEWMNLNGASVPEQYAACKSYVQYLEDAKRLCISKGECFEKWFSDIVANQKYFNRCYKDLKELEDKVNK